jgi:hypothetical protein
MMVDAECGAVGEMVDRGNRSIPRKPAPVLFCPPQISHDLTRAQTRTAAVGSRRLTDWAIAQPVMDLTQSVGQIAHVVLRARHEYSQRYVAAVFILFSCSVSFQTLSISDSYTEHGSLFARKPTEYCSPMEWFRNVTRAGRCGLISNNFLRSSFQISSEEACLLPIEA